MTNDEEGRRKNLRHLRHPRLKNHAVSVMLTKAPYGKIHLRHPLDLRTKSEL